MMRIRVLHAYYGCDTGCCGHIVEVDDEELDGSFEFIHFDGAKDPDVREFVLRHVPKECHDSIDWESIEVDSGCF
jgi:hypothetical protein